MENQDITVFAEYVLVKQTMSSKKGKIILSDLSKNEDRFNFSFEIVQLGDEVTRKIKVGDHPIFEKHVQFEGVKLLEKSDTEMVSLVIVHQNSIIGRDNTIKEVDNLISSL